MYEIEEFQKGKDILFRIKVSGDKRYGGWRSYRKYENRSPSPLYPWEWISIPGIQSVEWKVKE
jgi:hypothetical protein